MGKQVTALTEGQRKAIEVQGLTFRPAGKGFVCNQTGVRVNGRRGCENHRRRIAGILKQGEKEKLLEAQRYRSGQVYCPHCNRCNYNYKQGKKNCGQCGKVFLVV